MSTTAPPPPKPLRTYECKVKGGKYTSEVCATTASKARYKYFLDIGDCYHDLKIIDIEVRSLGAPRTKDDFRRMAIDRGIDFARVGMRVTVDGKPGTIAGHNYSAGLDVLFDGETYPSNCHPHWRVSYFDKAGNLIKEFKD